MKKHEFTFNASLKEDGTGYTVQVKHELIGFYTRHEIAVMTANLVECFQDQIIKSMKESIQESTISPN